MESQINDLENQSRRSSLLFLGIDDADFESWAKPEQLALELFKERLGVAVDYAQIKRAHRLGK